MVEFRVDSLKIFDRIAMFICCLFIVTCSVLPVVAPSFISIERLLNFQMQSYLLLVLPLAIIGLAGSLRLELFPAGRARAHACWISGLIAVVLFSSVRPAFFSFGVFFLILNASVALLLFLKKFGRTVLAVQISSLIAIALYFANRQAVDMFDAIVISFMAYDSVLAWLYLHVEKWPQSEKKWSISEVMAYLLFPGFFMRRALISPRSFIQDVTATDRGHSSLHFGRAAENISIGLAISFIFSVIAPRLRYEIGYQSFDLVRAMAVTLSYTLASFGWACLFGYRGIAPFNRFYLAYNPLEFWRRWNTPMRDFMSRLVFFPMVQRIPRVEIAFLATFFTAGILHGLPYGILQNGFRAEFVLKFWFFGIATAVFVFFYMKLSGFLRMIRPIAKVLLMGISWVLFWSGLFFVREAALYFGWIIRV